MNKTTDFAILLLIAVLAITAACFIPHYKAAKEAQHVEQKK